MSGFFQYSNYKLRYVVPVLRLENPGHIRHIPVPGSCVENSAHPGVARNQGHQLRRVINVDIIVQEDLVAPAPDTDKALVWNLVVCQPVFSVVYSPLASSRNDVETAQRLDSGNFRFQAGFCWRDILPRVPRLVQDFEELVFCDSCLAPRSPSVQVVKFEPGPETLVHDSAP